MLVPNRNQFQRSYSENEDWKVVVKLWSSKDSSFKGHTQKMRIERPRTFDYPDDDSIVSKVILRKWGLKASSPKSPKGEKECFKGHTQKMRIERGNSKISRPVSKVSKVILRKWGLKGNIFFEFFSIFFVSKVILRKWGLKDVLPVLPVHNLDCFKGHTQKMRIERLSASLNMVPACLFQRSYSENEDWKRCA